MSSSYSQSLDENIFEYIENDIRKYSELGNILLAGDLNARTGSGELDLDFIECDSNDNNTHHDEYIPDSDLPIRYSKDNVVTSRGRELNNFCIYSGLRILNGRIIGDFSGQMTCHTPNGSSVVDYFIASEPLLTNIAFFKVHKLNDD